MNRFNLFILLSFICVASVSAALITPALPLIQKYYSITNAQLDQLVAEFLIGYVIGQLLWGLVAERIGGLNALRAGLFLNLIGLLLSIAFVHWHYSFASLGFSRFITGLGSAAGLTCTILLIQQYLSEQKARHTLSFAILSFTLGVGIAVTVGGFLTVHYGWESIFLALLTHGLIMLVLTYLFEQPKFDKPKAALSVKHIARTYLQTLQNKYLIIFSLSLGVVSFVNYGYSASAPFYAQDTLHLSAEQYGYWNTLNMIGMIASSFLSAYLAKQFQASSILKSLLCCLLPVTFLLMYMGTNHIGSALLFFGITCSLFLISGAMFASATHLAINSSPNKASASGMVSFINMSSATLGVYLMHFLSADKVSAMSLMLIAFIGLCLFLIRTKKSQVNSSI